MVKILCSGAYRKARPKLPVFLGNVHKCRRSGPTIPHYRALSILAATSVVGAASTATGRMVAAPCASPPCRLGDLDEAMDIVQDAMLKLAESYGGHPGEEWRPLLLSHSSEPDHRPAAAPHDAPGSPASPPAVVGADRRDRKQARRYRLFC